MQAKGEKNSKLTHTGSKSQTKNQTTPLVPKHKCNNRKKATIITSDESAQANNDQCQDMTGTYTVLLTRTVTPEGKHARHCLQVEKIQTRLHKNQLRSRRTQHAEHILGYNNRKPTRTG
jgi:hypothetical protein